MNKLKDLIFHVIYLLFKTFFSHLNKLFLFYFYILFSILLLLVRDLTEPFPQE